MDTSASYNKDEPAPVAFDAHRRHSSSLAQSFQVPLSTPESLVLQPLAIMISIPILEIRTLDVAVLLLVGFVWEAATRIVVATVQAQSQAERLADTELLQLQYVTAQKRRLGPSAFVETSKLERQVLAKEKALEELVTIRNTRTARINKFVKNSNTALYGLIFVLYYNLSVLSIDGTRLGAKDEIIRTPLEETELATGYVQGLLFPISFVGIGMRIARYGLPTPGFGALLILWSSQVTIGKIIDGIELLL
jgi:hypothetical protein